MPLVHTALYSVLLPLFCRFDIKSTVAELKVIVSCPPPPTSKDSIDGNVIGGLPRSGSKSFAKNAKGGARGCVYGKSSPSKRKLFNDDVGKEQKKNNGKGKLLTVVNFLKEYYHSMSCKDELNNIKYFCR